MASHSAAAEFTATHIRRENGRFCASPQGPAWLAVVSPILGGHQMVGTLDRGWGCVWAMESSEVPPPGRQHGGATPGTDPSLRARAGTGWPGATGTSPLGSRAGRKIPHAPVPATPSVFTVIPPAFWALGCGRLATPKPEDTPGETGLPGPPLRPVEETQCGSRRPRGFGSVLAPGRRELTGLRCAHGHKLLSFWGVRGTRGPENVSTAALWMGGCSDQVTCIT